MRSFSAASSCVRSPGEIAAELGLNLASLQGRHDGRGLDEYGAEAIEVGFVLLEVLVEALARPVRAGLVLDKHEGSAAHHSLGRKLGILRQLVGAVDAVVGQGQRAEE